MSEPYKGLNAALARNSGPSAEDVETRDLSDVVHHFLGAACDATDLDVPPCWTLAQRILASDWLATHTAAAEARGAERGARAVVEWLASDAAEEAAAAGIADYAYPGLSQVECERAANAALSTLAPAAARVGGA